MEVYRICLAEYAQALFASGSRGRWNVKGSFVIYTAGSRALACLDNVVHRSGEGLKSIFKVIIIQVPDDLLMARILPEQLPAEWYIPQSYFLCQPLGEAWYQSRSTALLQVPSSIIFNEHNYILNSQHPDFQKIQILRRENFDFDPRIKSSDAGS